MQDSTQFWGGTFNQFEYLFDRFDMSYDEIYEFFILNIGRLHNTILPS